MLKLRSANRIASYEAVYLEDIFALSRVVVRSTLASEVLRLRAHYLRVREAAGGHVNNSQFQVRWPSFLRYKKRSFIG